MAIIYSVGDLVQEEVRDAPPDLREQMSGPRLGLVTEVYEGEPEEEDVEEPNSFIRVLWPQGQETYELWGGIEEVSWLPIIDSAFVG